MRHILYVPSLLDTSTQTMMEHLYFQLSSQQERTLNLTVQKDSRDETTRSQNVKELSGGERSFATLALLLAIGESIECPFRGTWRARQPSITLSRRCLQAGVRVLVSHDRPLQWGERAVGSKRGPSRSRVAFEA